MYEPRIADKITVDLRCDDCPDGARWSTLSVDRGCRGSGDAGGRGLAGACERQGRMARDLRAVRQAERYRGAHRMV